MSNSDERDRVKKCTRLLAVKQAIFELGIGRTAIYELIKNGKLENSDDRPPAPGAGGSDRRTHRCARE